MDKQTELVRLCQEIVWRNNLYYLVPQGSWRVIFLHCKQSSIFEVLTKGDDAMAEKKNVCKITLGVLCLAYSQLSHFSRFPENHKGANS